MRCAQKGSRHCSTGRVLPWLIMMSKGKIIGAAIAAASALETVVAVSGSTRTNPDQMIMKAAATKPAVTIALMFLLIANLLVDCRGEVSLRKQPDIPNSAHRRVSCVHRKTGFCSARMPRTQQQGTAQRSVRQRPARWQMLHSAYLRYGARMPGLPKPARPPRAATAARAGDSADGRMGLHLVPQGPVVGRRTDRERSEKPAKASDSIADICRRGD
jgi:hypothetical protein